MHVLRVCVCVCACVLLLRKTKITVQVHVLTTRAGIANATTAGWGNLGGGVTQLIMPLIFKGITAHEEPFIAWRWAMFVPAFMHIIAGVGVLFFSTDLPDGNYAVLKKSNKMSKDNPMNVFLTAILNYRCAVTPPTCSGLFAARQMHW
jgi:sugar phosphate permease